MDSFEFEQWWSNLTARLPVGTVVQHWSAESTSRGKELEGEFEVFEMGPDYLRIGWRTTVHRIA